MGTLLTICVIVAFIGLIIILLSVIGPTSTFVPHGTHTGITLLILGVVLYIILILITGHNPYIGG